MTGWYQVALGAATSPTDGDDVIHRHVRRPQRRLTIMAPACLDQILPPARLLQLAGFVALASDFGGAGFKFHHGPVEVSVVGFHKTGFITYVMVDFKDFLKHIIKKT